ncbi:MAG: DNA-binding response regulator, partial [bacterium]
IVSNRKELQDRINGFLAGAKRYICKPFEMADLLKHAVFHTRNSEISSGVNLNSLTRVSG